MKKRGKCKYGCNMMQMGGPKQSDYGTNIEAWQQAMDDWMNSMNTSEQSTRTVAPSYNPFGNSPWIANGQRNPLVPARETQIPLRHPGWHDTPEDIDPQTGETWDERVEQARGDSSVTETTTQPYHNWNQDIYFGLRGAQMGATYLAGKKRDSTMDEYDYKQQSALGQMNPMPVSQFQYNENNYTTPNRLYAEKGGMMNPYSYHSKYGGNLKTIIKDYQKWSNDAGPMDMTDGNVPRYPERKKGGFALDELVVRDFISKLMAFGHGPHPYGGMRRSRYQQGGTNPFAQPTPKLSQDVINYLHGLPSQEEQYLRQKNTIVAVPGGSTIPGDSIRYMTGRENQFGVPYTIDKLGVKGIMEGGADKFLGLPRDKARIYQDSTLGNVNGFYEKGGNWIQGAVNPAHKGYCSPMTKATCTPRRKAFAETMKKHHGFHK